MKYFLESINWSRVLLPNFKALITHIIAVLHSITFPEGHPLVGVADDMDALLMKLRMATEGELVKSEKAELDSHRDMWLDYIIGEIKNKCDVPLPTQQEAALTLWKAFDELDSLMSRLSMTEESEQVKLLRKRWDNEACKAALTTLHLEESYAKLVTAQDIYELYCVEYTSDAKTGSSNSNELKLQVKSIAREVLVLIRSLANVKGDELCIEALGRINKLIADEDTLIRSRKTKRDNKE